MNLIRGNERHHAAWPRIGGSPIGIRPTTLVLLYGGWDAGLSALSGAGGTYFFTVNLLERRLDTLVRHVDTLREAVRVTKRERPFHIDAWVVLPDHLHAVWTLPPGDDDFSNRWKAIKIRFVQAIPRTERRSRTRIARGERGIWQRRFWEHAIRDEIDYARHVDYVHWNPIKHGLVQRLADWPYSSFHRYVRDGMLSADWCGEVNELTTVSDH